MPLRNIKIFCIVVVGAIVFFMPRSLRARLLCAMLRTHEPLGGHDILHYPAEGTLPALAGWTVARLLPAAPLT